MRLERGAYEVMTVCACEALRRSARSLTSLYREALADSGVGVAQLPILVAAALMGRAPITSMAEVLVIDRTTLSRNLANLEEQGLVAIEDDRDRRLRLVVLTGPGRDALEAAMAAWRQAHDQVEAAFGLHRLKALVSELAALTEATRS